MRPRRTAASPPPLDADGWSTDTGEATYDLLADSPREAPVSHGPLSICLVCGADPSVRSECSHDEVARLDVAPASLHIAAQRLRELAADRAQQERLVRRLVSVEVSHGGGEVTRTEQPLAFLPTPIPQNDLTVPGAMCPRCASTRRRKTASDAQGMFAFAVPTAPKVVATPAVEAPSTEAPVAPIAEPVPTRKRKPSARTKRVPAVEEPAGV